MRTLVWISAFAAVHAIEGSSRAHAQDAGASAEVNEDGEPERETAVDAEPTRETEAPRPGAIVDLELERASQGHERETTKVASPRSGAHVVWAVLALPERLVEAAFLPIGALVVLSERHNLPQRVEDFLENDAGTIVVAPKLKVSTGEGFGAGASLNLISPLASQSRLRLSGLYELDNDFQLAARYSRRIASADGRGLVASLSYKTESGYNYFGIGDKTTVDKRELGIDSLVGTVSLDLNDRGADRFYGTCDLGYTRQKLYAGSGTAPPVGEPGDTVVSPPGFGDTVNFASIGFTGRIDSRDTEARTSRGVLLELSARLMLDVADGQRSAVTARATTVIYIPILGRRRTLAVSGGLGVAQQVTEDGEVPFDAFVVLGRNNFLRGYDRERFHTTRGWWAGADYHYPIWYLNKYPVVLTSRLFFDIGVEGDSFEDLIEGPLRYSGGAGLTIERFKSSYSGIQFALSPEGEQIVFTAGTLL